MTDDQARTERKLRQHANDFLEVYERLTRLQAIGDRHSARFVETIGALHRLEGQMDAAQSTLDGHTGQLSDLGFQAAQLRAELRALTSTVDGLTSTVDGLTSTVDGLTSTVDGLTATVDGHTATLDAHTATLDAHTATLADHSAQLLVIQAGVAEILRRLPEAS